jgi:hypothetical protein
MLSFPEIVHHVQMKKVFSYTIHSLTKNYLYTYMFGGD